MPAMNFRQEFGAISGLSIVLVVGSALLLGLFFMVAIPDRGFARGVAVGAIISPTDAVATSIVRQTSVSKRVVAMLDGESLLNDAIALVLLRTATIATAAACSCWGAAGTFAYSVVVAIMIGVLVGWLNLAQRQRVTDPTVNTAISFAVPFVAAVPAGQLEASGLGAAVVAGLITGIRSPRDLSPQDRLSDSQNWRTVELVLEGAVFLTMGLQLKSIVMKAEEDHAGVWTAALVAAGALVLILIRAAYVAPLLAILDDCSRNYPKLQTRVQGMQERITAPDGQQATFAELNVRRRPASQRDLERFVRRISQSLADIEYYLRAPLGWREGVAVVWAGMRGAVTVAAAQTAARRHPAAVRAGARRVRRWRRCRCWSRAAPSARCSACSRPLGRSRRGRRAGRATRTGPASPNSCARRLGRRCRRRRREVATPTGFASGRAASAGREVRAAQRSASARRPRQRHLRHEGRLTSPRSDSGTPSRRASRRDQASRAGSSSSAAAASRSASSSRLRASVSSRISRNRRRSAGT